MTKKILITGKNSYVGNKLIEWLEKESGKYEVVKETVRDDKWKGIGFSKFDVVVHVAGIAHIKETEENKSLYYKINRDLAYEVAKKAKADGVKQFIFLSSMSVYGLDKGIIDKETPLNPTTAYGKSKVEAEKLINEIRDDSFSVAILRPPMIYGKACKGNYSKLAKLALKTPLFPKVDNKRSMIYVDNLSEFIKQLIDTQKQGLYFPQNTEYINTSDMVKLITEIHGKKLLMPKLFNPLLKSLNLSIINKLFGNLVIDKKLSHNLKDYNISNFEETILLSEK